MKVLTVAVTSSVTTVQVASSTITASSLGSTESMLDPWEEGRVMYANGCFGTVQHMFVYQGVLTLGSPEIAFPEFISYHPLKAEITH